MSNVIAIHDPAVILGHLLERAARAEHVLVTMTDHELARECALIHLGEIHRFGKELHTSIDAHMRVRRAAEVETE